MTKSRFSQREVVCLNIVITKYRRATEQKIIRHLQVLQLAQFTYLGLPYITTLLTANIGASNDGMFTE